MHLFDQNGEWIEDEQLRVFWQPRFFSLGEADCYFQQLQKQVAWQQGTVQLFGQRHAEPRLSAYYGDSAASYEYSHRKMQPTPWIPSLQDIKQRLEAVSPETFNAVLCNLYRNGQDSMGWHSDDEAALGREPCIASINFGDSRRFILRQKNNHQHKKEFTLGHGDLLIMAGQTQLFWQHHVPKTAKVKSERINLTFRKIIE